MTKKQVIEMLKDIVKELDYDIYKETFTEVHLEGDNPVDGNEDVVDDLIKQVSKHISICN